MLIANIQYSAFTGSQLQLLSRLQTRRLTPPPNPERVWGLFECWFTGGEYSDEDLDRGSESCRACSLSIVKVGGSASGYYVDGRSLELGRIMNDSLQVSGSLFLRRDAGNLNFSLFIFLLLNATLS